MKMTPEDFAQLKDAVAPYDDMTMRERYRTGQFPRADLVKDLNKRYRWDLLWRVPNDVRGPLVDRLYTYLNDAQLDTALKAIVQDVKGE